MATGEARAVVPEWVLWPAWVLCGCTAVLVASGLVAEGGAGADGRVRPATSYYCIRGSSIHYCGKHW